MEENLIIDYEERLREAMLIGDVNSLDNLINDNLIFCESLWTNINEGSRY